MIFSNQQGINDSVQISVNILSSLLTGGFLLFFIETMHIESDVKQRQGRATVLCDVCRTEDVSGFVI